MSRLERSRRPVAGGQDCRIARGGPRAARLLTRVILAAGLASGFAAGARADDPFGTWMRPSTGTQVNFYNCGGKLCGKIVAVKDQSRKGEVGTIIMNGAAKTGDKEWRGDLLNTEDGKTYSGVVTLEGPNALNLKGCAALGIICKGEIWQRVK
jgi:uncharacterized protein (DUF2147 family)